ncbi:hypothetical protein [Hyphococcus sp.]|uniref:hypothetical protein n=1 Tax=Hyphococcus sp. TaxID=2038636 RepID=UPI003CCBF53E
MKLSGNIIERSGGLASMSRAAMKIASLYIGVLFLAACSQGAQNDTHTADKTEDFPAARAPSTPAEKKDIAEKARKEERAVVTIGDQSFQLDRIFCIPGMAQTIIISDSQRRSGYPEVKLVDFGDNAPGLPLDQASFDFRDGDQRTLWQLEAGDVVKTGDRVRASGTLHGGNMIERADGNEKSAPLGENNILDFSVEAAC